MADGLAARDGEAAEPGAKVLEEGPLAAVGAHAITAQQDAHILVRRLQQLRLQLPVSDGVHQLHQTEPRCKLHCAEQEYIDTAGRARPIQQREFCVTRVPGSPNPCCETLSAACHNQILDEENSRDICIFTGGILECRV